MRPGISRRVAAALAAAWIFVVLVLVPSAQAGFFSFDLKDERELGEKFNAIIRARMPLIQDTEIDTYVNGLITRLIKVMPPQPFPFTVSIIANNSVNAFAGPAGYVFIFTGLLINMDHESEVVGVLAHEMGHVTQRHIAQRMGQMKMLSIGQVVGMLAGVLIGTTTQNYDMGGALALGSQAAAAQTYLKYSRDNEREADNVGMNYLVAAGFRPQGMLEAFETLQRLKWLQGGGTIPTYLSTHPGLVERMSYLKDRIKLLPAPLRHRKDHDAAFKRIQMLVRARYTDPKNAVAYFRKQHDPSDCLNKIGLAIALSRALENIHGAQPAFEAALACAPSDPLVLREAGRYFLKIRDFARAKKLLQAAVRQSPSDIDALFEYGRLLAQEGNYRGALPYLEQVCMRAPDIGEIHAVYGQALGQSGDLFHAYLHLAYAALYENNKRQAEYQMDRAKKAAKGDGDRRELVRLEETMKKRARLFKKRSGF